jgi:hypothetical protein
VLASKRTNQIVASYELVVGAHGTYKREDGDVWYSDCLIFVEKSSILDPSLLRIAFSSRIAAFLGGKAWRLQRAYIYRHAALLPNILRLLFEGFLLPSVVLVGLV